MRNTSLGSNSSVGISGLIENLPLLLQEASEQLNSLSVLLSACMEPIEDDNDLQERMGCINQLYLYSSDVNDIPATFAELIADRVYEYEKKHRDVPHVSQAEALAFFIEERGLKQSDLKQIATQSVISDIINGKRTMTLQQVKDFSRYFNVPVETFID
ncbi:helix-turn-helix domain-containing protein [Pectobacterium carotovorum]|uniref:helix-turn-helix domain-containing protein n=1 Tax=Pectobacterium carotovorum TaxID=554 RepID=UPI003018A943